MNKVKPNQSLLDKALESNGDVGAFIDIALANGKALDEELSAGEELQAAGEVNEQIKPTFNTLAPANGQTSTYVPPTQPPINPNCQDAEVEVNGQHTVLAPSGLNTPITIVSSIGSTLLLTDNGNDVFEVPNGGIFITDEDGTPLATFPITPAVTEPYTAPSGDIEINGSIETDVLSGGLTEIETVDQNDDPITPTITNTGGRNLKLEFTVGGSGSTPSVGATLMKTGQTTSYATGDDGDIQAGRELDFFTLHGAPLMANGSPTIHTSDKRFTDELGGQAYANDIVIDWSTFDNQNNTVLGVQKSVLAITNIDWLSAISYCNSVVIGGFTNWRQCNYFEFVNFINFDFDQYFKYPPFNNPLGSFWTSNSIDASTAIRFVGGPGFGTSQRLTNSGSNSAHPLPVRTFTVNGTNPLT